VREIGASVLLPPVGLDNRFWFKPAKCHALPHTSSTTSGPHDRSLHLDASDPNAHLGSCLLETLETAQRSQVAQTKRRLAAVNLERDDRTSSPRDWSRSWALVFQRLLTSQCSVNCTSNLRANGRAVLWMMNRKGCEGRNPILSLLRLW
jgi:hypothetical protein